VNGSWDLATDRSWVVEMQGGCEHRRERSGKCVTEKRSSQHRRSAAQGRVFGAAEDDDAKRALVTVA
jgi:hypothetical protein